MNNTKLTRYQNRKITEVLCRMAEKVDDGVFCDADAENLTMIRRSLVRECEKVNLATSSVSRNMSSGNTAEKAAEKIFGIMREFEAKVREATERSKLKPSPNAHMAKVDRWTW